MTNTMEKTSILDNNGLQYKPTDVLAGVFFVI